MSVEIVEREDGDFVRKPAFQVTRFKATVLVSMNAEMAEDLIGLLTANEKVLTAKDEAIPTHLYSLNTQLSNKVENRKAA